LRFAGGKLNRGLSVVHTVQAIRGAPLTPEEGRDAAVIGWCLEWVQAFFLVADDVMDASPTRRGQPCWYKLPAVGLIAINDSIMLHSQVFLFLRRYFRSHPAYVDLIELFNDTVWQVSACGRAQGCDHAAQALFCLMSAKGGLASHCALTHALCPLGRLSSDS
jgi:geranylgeranyl pyrophosphate synthase